MATERGRSHARPQAIGRLVRMRKAREPKRMMNGREKSGPAVVAMKPANKVGQPAAELVEPRAGAEGNAGQERTLRTQGRDGAPQGLDRVRQAARQGKARRRGSPRSCTTSTSTGSRKRSTR